MPLLQKCVNDMVEKLKKDTENGEVVDVCKYCGSFSMDVIASTAFGMDVDAQNDPDNAFIKNAKKAFSSGLKNPMLLFVLFFPFTRGILSYFKLSTLSKEMATFFHSAVNTAIDERKSESSKRQDLLGLMLNAHTDKEKSEENIELSSTTLKDFKKRREYIHSYHIINFQKGWRGKVRKHTTNNDYISWKALTTNEILANSLTFFLAGYETTANALSFVLYCLALYPDYADKVRYEVADDIGKEKPTYDNVSKLQYLDMFVCEVLRLYGPAARFNRTTEEDVAIGGYKVPKGTDIQFAIGVIHRDPEFWPEPEVLIQKGSITFDKGGFIKAQNGIKLKLEKR
ncbi:CYP5A [Mytilus edulis]|uniref:TBXAS1 n=1 Tax=Mytilus edulis TaxID=6550 RepID=A0A8S3SQA8_MYTED|nr:CYP5A [Mytilus edulis]